MLQDIFNCDWSIVGSNKPKRQLQKQPKKPQKLIEDNNLATKIGALDSAWNILLKELNNLCYFR